MLVCFFPCYLAKHTLYYNPFLIGIFFYIPIVIISGNTFPEWLLTPVKATAPKVRCLGIAFFPTEDCEKNAVNMFCIGTNFQKASSSWILLLLGSYQNNASSLSPLLQKRHREKIAVPFCIVFVSVSYVHKDFARIWKKD